jgi:6-pyruvoyltetrahydropterin/6-carboxytetrahydropterin synthase
LHVTVKGEVHPETGFVINAKELGDIMKKNVIDLADHLNLNIDVAFMAGKLTSAENFAIGIWNQLEEEVQKLGAQMHCVKLIETPRIYVEYFGK